MEISLVNLQEVLDPLDVLRKLFGIRIQDMYNKMLVERLDRWAATQLMRVLQLVVRAYHAPSVKVLERFWFKIPRRTWWCRWCRISIALCGKASTRHFPAGRLLRC